MPFMHIAISNRISWIYIEVNAGCLFLEFWLSFMEKLRQYAFIFEFFDIFLSQTFILLIVKIPANK